MRVAGFVALALLAGCASDKLALSPPPGVDFSGRWKLNEADSDDPLRLYLSQNDTPATTAPGPAGQGGQGGGGRGGRGGGRGGPAAGLGGASAPGGPVMPPVSTLSDGLRWPGKDLDIKQTVGVVSITSGGASQVYQPSPNRKRHPHGKPPDDESRDMPARDRGDGPPAACGWDDKTLVVQPRSIDEDGPPFEERYSVSSDGQRLIEIVAFKGGRSGGYTVSRVWDRVQPDGVAAAK